MISTEQVRLARQGDVQAQTALYESMYKRIYYLALRMTRRAEDAEDVTQETFLSAFQALPNLDDLNAFEGWLFQIAANKSRKLLRKNNRLAQLPADEDGCTMLDDLPVEDEALIPAAVLDKASDRQILLDLIESLPEQQRQCVYLFYYAQLSVKQIAETLECSEGTVKSRLNYARQKLRDAVLATEERDGIRLHALAPLGLLLLKDCQLSTAGLTISALSGAGGATAAGSAAGTGAKTGLLATAKAKVIAGGTAAAITVGGGAAIVSQLPKPLTFTDPAMEANIRLLLDKPQGKLYPEDAAELYSIYLFEDGIATDDGRGTPVMEAMAGTTAVDSLADLTQLPELRHLYCQTSNTALLDTVGQWPGLETLVALHQDDAAVSDVSFLENMPDLTQLGIQVTGDTDLMPLEQCGQLQVLNLLSDGNVTVSVDGLPHLRELTVLTNQHGTAPDSTVSIVTTKPLPELLILDLHSGVLPDLEFLHQTPALRLLSMYSENIGDLDLSPLGTLPQLRCLSLMGHYDDTLDLGPLADCAALEVCFCPNGTVLNPPPQAVTDLTAAQTLYNQIQLEIYDEIYTTVETTP